MAFDAVIVDARELYNFRRRALLRYPKEYMEVFWGQLRGNKLYISVFDGVRHSSSSRHVDVKEDDNPDYGDKHDGLTLLGSIHTHPNNDAIPSLEDYQSAHIDGEVAMGIMSIHKINGFTKTELLFYPSIKPIACTVVGKKSGAHRQAKYAKTVKGIETRYRYNHSKARYKTLRRYRSKPEIRDYARARELSYRATMRVLKRKVV